MSGTERKHIFFPLGLCFDLTLLIPVLEMLICGFYIFFQDHSYKELNPAASLWLPILAYHLIVPFVVIDCYCNYLFR